MNSVGLHLKDWSSLYKNLLIKRQCCTCCSTFHSTTNPQLKKRRTLRFSQIYVTPARDLGMLGFSNRTSQFLSRDPGILSGNRKRVMTTDYLALLYPFASMNQRYLHIAAVLSDKSKVEDSLKEIQKQKVVDPSTFQAQKFQVAKPPKKPLWDRFKAEVMHYYHGFRLLGLDLRIASKTLWKVLRGRILTRRESNQFKRALSDIFRLAPFSVFIIIPFAELALPIVIRLFPRMLPSTFEDKSTRETRLRGELAVKLKMAKFMQDTVEDIAMRSKKSSKENQATQDFANFFKKIRTTAEDPTNEEILKHAKLFEDELTLDSMTRPQLVALCRLIQVPAVGSNNLLRFLLQLKLKRLHADDTVIQREGIESLNETELQVACQARGMRALGMSKIRLQQQLQQWIDLHLNHDVPSSLLLLSRVLFMPDTVPVEKMVKEAMSALPDKVADEAEVRAAELNCERIDNTTRYKATRQEEIDIAKEKAEENEKEKEKSKIERERKLKEEQELERKKQELSEELIQTAAQPASMVDTIELSKEPLKEDIAPVLKDEAPVLSEAVGSSAAALPDAEVISEGPVQHDMSPVMKEEITKQEIDVLDKVIGSMKKGDSLDKAKSELEDLREDLVEYQQDVMSLDENFAHEEDEMSSKEKKASSRLQNRIVRFINEMDTIVKKLEKGTSELEVEDATEKHTVSVEELKNTLRTLGDMPEDKLHTIAHILDKDKDGEIDLEEALLAIKTLDSEDVSVTGRQLHELICLVKSANGTGEKKKDKQE